jgi:hypothetical protein
MFAPGLVFVAARVSQSQLNSTCRCAVPIKLGILKAYDG